MKDQRQTILEKKASLRKAILKERSALAEADRQERSLKAAAYAKSLLFQEGIQDVLAFYPYASEIDTRPLLEEALQRGLRVWLPVTFPEERRIVPHRFLGDAYLREGAYGIREPDPALAEPGDAEKMDLILLPGVAFDLRGWRLGYGGGYYDRLLGGLKRCPLLIGYAFHLQVTDEVPKEPHDRRMDYLVTDAGCFGPFDREESI